MILYLCVGLLLFVMLGACSPQMSQLTTATNDKTARTAIPSSTLVPVTLTSTIGVSLTFTPAPPPTSTTTLTSSPLPTFTPTVPIIPSLTPATIADSPDAYNLKVSTADEADKIITRMEQTILEFWEDPGQHRQPPYSVVWHAAVDALLHFPNDPRAEKWLWKTIYYMALSGEGAEATEMYIDLIADAINLEGRNSQDLPDWFQSGELETFYLTPKFTLEIESIDVPGSDAAYLIRFGELFDIDTPGGSCALIVKNDNKYTPYIIYDGFPLGGFSIMERNPVYCFAQDVTDDGIDEIIVDHYNGGHVGTTYISVFDIISLPPKVMPFSQSLNEKLIIGNGWIFDYPTENNKTQIQIGEPLSFCQDYGGYGVSYYQWNGAWFEIKQGWVEFDQSPILNDDSLSVCSRMINEYVGHLKPDNALSIYDYVFKIYTPNISRNQEILEEFRVSKGINAAYLGDQDLAHTIFNEIISSPSITDSIWIEPSQNFLTAYQSTSNLYSACSTVNICAPYYSQYSSKECVDLELCDYEKALQAIANTTLNSSLTELTQNLGAAGVQIPSEGWYDFDGDALDERWFTVLPPGEKRYEFWIAVEYTEGIKALLVADNLSTYELNFQLVREGASNLLVDFGYDQMLQLVRHPITKEPVVIVEVVEVIEPIIQDLNTFYELRKDLFDGYDVISVYEHLLELENKYPECPFEIKSEDGPVYIKYDCASFYYILGLAAELSGKESEAVKYYYVLWQQYPHRPLAELARYKLE